MQKLAGPEAKEVEGPVVALPAQSTSVSAVSAVPAAQMMHAAAPTAVGMSLRVSPTPISGASTSPALPVGGDVAPHTVRSGETSYTATAPAPCAQKLLATLPAQAIPVNTTDRLLASQPAGKVGQVGEADVSEVLRYPDGQRLVHAAPDQSSVAQPQASLTTPTTAQSDLPTSQPTQALYDQPAAGETLTMQLEDQQPLEQQLPLKDVVAEPASADVTTATQCTESTLPAAEKCVLPAEAEPEPERSQPSSIAAGPAGSPISSRSSPIKPTVPMSPEAAGTVSDMQASPHALGSPQPPVKAFTESPSSPSQLPCSGDAAAGVGKVPVQSCAVDTLLSDSSLSFSDIVLAGGPIVEEEAKARCWHPVCSLAVQPVHQASPRVVVWRSLDGSSAWG